MLRRQADMSPPDTPPIHMPVRRVRPSTALIKNVKGIAKATPMAAVRPGMAPKIIPQKTPKTRSKNVNG
jgi:hypothetical protein